MRAGWLVVATAIVASACATKAPVRVEPELPTLDPPLPPPRVIALYVDEEAPEPAPMPAAPEKPATPPRPAARPSKVEPRLEPPRAEAARPAVAPPLTLSPSPGTEVQTEAAIRNLLSRAARDLSRVNAASLGADGRAQYDTAQRFLQQAEEALKVRNLVFAGKLADKAATLAAGFAR